jgi:hypothetical protein
MKTTYWKLFFYVNIILGVWRGAMFDLSIIRDIKMYFFFNNVQKRPDSNGFTEYWALLKEDFEFAISFRGKRLNSELQVFPH